MAHNAYVFGVPKEFKPDIANLEFWKGTRADAFINASRLAWMLANDYEFYRLFVADMRDDSCARYSGELSYFVAVCGDNYDEYPIAW